MVKNLGRVVGKSAYEIAVDNGFTGTVEEWLESLKGEKGDTSAITIGTNGNWYIDGVDSGEPAKGDAGITPHIGQNGHWYIGDADTNVSAIGIAPTVGANGNWYINGVDSNIPATGSQGDSAYQVAVENGFTGTVEQWLESLIGATGSQGETGATGPQGPKGDTGDPADPALVQSAVNDYLDENGIEIPNTSGRTTNFVGSYYSSGSADINILINSHFTGEWATTNEAGNDILSTGNSITFASGIDVEGSSVLTINAYYSAVSSGLNNDIVQSGSNLSISGGVTVVQTGSNLSLSDTPVGITPITLGNCQTVSGWKTDDIITLVYVNGVWIQVATGLESKIAELRADIDDILDNGFTPEDIQNAVSDYLDENGASVEQAYINVKDYGAKGDGITDDTDNIRLARDAAVIAKKPLFFPSGTYMVHGTIQLYSNMTVYGATDAILKKIAAVTQDIVADADVGDNIVYVSDASAFTVGYDVYIGQKGWGNYSDTVGIITAIDTDNNSITFRNYHRHSQNDNAGLARAVTTAADGVVSQAFSILSTMRYDDSGDNLKIEDLTFDGNAQYGEPVSYVLSPVHIDPYSGAGSNVDGKGLLIRNCTVINCNADGFSMQNMGRTTVENCTVYDPKTEGIHPGYQCDGVNICNCYVYNAGDAGIYDCNHVHGMNISNCYLYNCFYGIQGLDYTSRGTTINGCVFDSCTTGIRGGAETYGGAVAGCSFVDCNKGISLYHGSGDIAVSGCSFGNCVEGVTFQTANRCIVANNYFNNCKHPVNSTYWSSDQTQKGSGIIIANNLLYSSETGKNSTMSIGYMDKAIIMGNMLLGNNAAISIDEDTASNITQANNIIY